MVSNGTSIIGLTVLYASRLLSTFSAGGSGNGGGGGNSDSSSSFGFGMGGGIGMGEARSYGGRNGGFYAGGLGIGDGIGDGSGGGGINGGNGCNGGGNGQGYGYLSVVNNDKPSPPSSEISTFIPPVALDSSPDSDNIPYPSPSHIVPIVLSLPCITYDEDPPETPIASPPSLPSEIPLVEMSAPSTSPPPIPPASVY